MKIQNIILLILLITALGGYSNQGVSAPFSFESNPIETTQYWRELEIFRNEKIYCGADGLNGEIWFATKESLLKYDGYEIQRFDLPEGLEEPMPYDLWVNKDGIVYLSASEGVYSFSENEWKCLIPIKIIFKNPITLFYESAGGIVYTRTPEGIASIRGDLVESMAVLDPDARAFTINNNTLWAMSPTEAFKARLDGSGRVQHDTKESFPLKVPSGKLPPNYNIAATASGEVVIYSSSPVYQPLVFDANNRIFVESNMSDLIGPQWFSDSISFENEILFFGKTGVVRFQKGEWKVLNTENKIPISNGHYFERKNGSIIAGGLGEKIYEIDYANNQWKSFKGLLFGCQTDNGNYWFLTLNGDILERDEGENRWIRHQMNTIDTPTRLYRSQNNWVWATGSHQGIAAVSFFDGQHWTLNLHPKLVNIISHQSIIEAQSGEIIMGSGQELYKEQKRGVLLKYDPSKQGCPYEYIENLDSRFRVAVASAWKNDVLIGGGQIVRMNNENKVTLLEVPGVDSNNFWVDSMLVDHSETLWLGLWGFGVFSYDGNDWSSFHEPYSLLGNNIVDLVCDQENNIWAASSSGISKYHRKTSEWIPNAISINLQLQREGAEIQVDQNNDLWINKATRNWFIPPETGSSFPISDVPFETIRYTSDDQAPIIGIRPYREKVIESSNVYVSWDGIDYLSKTPQDALVYSYQLNEQEWSEYSAETDLVLSDLSKGSYQLQIRCRDLDGNISKDYAVAKFVVVLPLIKQWWFILSIISVVLVILGLIISIVRLNIRNTLQLEEFKIDFFANISHDLRTPLTAILGPLTTLREQSHEDEQRAHLDIAFKNAKKMHNLVDQLLEFRKIQVGKLENCYIRANVINRISETVEMARSFADDRSQQLILSISEVEFFAWVDCEKLERVVENLLLNAIKYTQQNGLISVQSLVKQSDFDNEDILEIIIEDNGPGIPDFAHQQVFKPFYRAKPHNASNIKGSGLGLALTQSLVEVMNGTLALQSPITHADGETSGTRFIVRIPILKTIEGGAEQQIAVVDNGLQSLNSAKLNPIILVVEDDRDILEYLSIELKSSYQILKATNGAAGFTLAKTHIPDVVLTDIMMPVSDGKQLCRKLKTAEETSHIPIIAVTALNSGEQQVKILEKGAADVISKPFSIALLKQKLKNLLEHQEKLRSRFLQQTKENSQDIRTLSNDTSDEAFVNRSLKLIEENLENPMFDVELLSQQMFMSRATLYRKFRAVTGNSPSAFIKSIRMNKAAALLREGKLTVAEISDAIGIQGSSYFSSAFKGYFKMTPKEYQQQNRGK